ncbi:hypothetical protein Riv7116_6028 [Rivularia sp. PCC 7116]|uniref:right-handed parallel beta-helix repeat-containing protein n=1 Tax=Rivularia sp. PCC 7116 TaxID=373994 RepID=UPI00029EE4FF|nr:right-handed parallel beta-helix repeat-containing protein [Rivularia sp. PCC 7116]AFY58386.1 hypothetical protein Riv7116_6028 [Rivularia sp. PCC 7116]
MAIITVTSTADSGEGTLREAILNANSGDTVRFDSALANKKITLTSGQLDIDKDLSIDGADAENFTISGNKSSRVFFVGRGKDFTLKNLTVSDAKAVSGKVKDNKAELRGGGVFADDYATLTIDNVEFKDNVADRGAGIYLDYRSQGTVLNSSFDNNDGTPANSGFSAGAIAAQQTQGLTVENSRFTNNKGITGGAIYSLLGPLTVENSVFLKNSAKDGGGAIFTDGASPGGPRGSEPGTIAIRNSQFEGNEAAGHGGGLFLFSYKQDKVFVEDSTVINNSLSKSSKGIALGGGIRGGLGELTIRNTTIADNTSEMQGGGLWYDGPNPLTIENTTLSGNRAVSDDEETFDAGGGIFINPPSSAPISISNSTIVDNTAGDGAGALWFSGKNEITLSNSIVANNSSNNGTQTSFQLIDGGGNIEFSEPDGRGRVVEGSQIVDPKLDSLQTINGSLVRPLKSNSPAIDAGTSTSIKTDQRGVVRDSSPDVGAFEFTSNPSNSQSPNSPEPESESPPTVLNNEPLRYEAEELTLNGYQVETVEGSGASGGKHISLKGTRGNKGFATGTFNGEAGTYQVEVGYYDENDGQSRAKVTVEEETTSFIFNQDLPDGWAKPAAKTSRIAIEKVQLQSGDTFKIEGNSNQGEFARFDYIEFSPIEDVEALELNSNSLTPQSPNITEPQSSTENDSLVSEVSEPVINGIVNLRNVDFDKDDRIDQKVSLILDDINSTAFYSNSGGFYEVLDLDGSVVDKVTNQLILPGEKGYETAALNQRITELEFDADNANLTTKVDGGIILAPYLITNGTPQEFLDKNPTNNMNGNALNAYFGFGNANPDGIEHLKSLDNGFAFEDMYGGGDKDFSDLTFTVTVESA